MKMDNSKFEKTVSLKTEFIKNISKTALFLLKDNLKTENEQGNGNIILQMVD